MSTADEVTISINKFNTWLNKLFCEHIYHQWLQTSPMKGNVKIFQSDEKAQQWKFPLQSTPTLENLEIVQKNRWNILSYSRCWSKKWDILRQYMVVACLEKAFLHVMVEGYNTNTRSECDISCFVCTVKSNSAKKWCQWYFCQFDFDCQFLKQEAWPYMGMTAT